MFFDFTGISYLSRAQEADTKLRLGNPRLGPLVVDSTSLPSVADAVFIGRIKSRVMHWKKTCKIPKESTNGKGKCCI